MDHTNLFLFNNQTDFQNEYPNDRVDTPIPGVAYVRASGNDKASTYYNRMVTTYPITIHSKNRSGVTVAQDYEIQTPKVLDGKNVKMNVVAESVEGYKPRYAVEKVEFTSASTEHTVIYLAATSYTVTVNHVFSGETLSSTTIDINDIFEEDVVKVKVEPISLPGLTAETVYISVSGDTTYNLVYQSACQQLTYVDLGLPSGALWATCNLGASSPAEPGDFYSWGELAPKSAYTLDTYSFYDPQEDEYTKYSWDDGRFYLEVEDDAARQNACGNWRIPSCDDVYELFNYTNQYDDTVGGRSVLVFESRNNGNQIMVPYDGYMNEHGYSDEATQLWCLELYAYYGESEEMATAWGFCGEILADDVIERYYGLHIRPVMNGTEPGPETGVLAGSAEDTKGVTPRGMDIPEMSEGGVKKATRPGFLFVKWLNKKEEPEKTEGEGSDEGNTK